MLGKTLFIGVGSMGGALLRGALQHGVLKASDTHILVRREEQCKALTEELGVVGFTTLPNVNEYNTILLAVKSTSITICIRDVKRSTLWDCYDFRCCRYHLRYSGYSDSAS